MSLDATCNPSSGPAPGSAGFVVDVTGGVPPVVCEPAPPPAPNPDPFPEHTITGPDANGDFHVVMIGDVDSDTELNFRVSDGDSQTAVATFHANP